MSVETAVAIQVRFSADTKSGVVQDAMYFTPEEYAGLKQADIEALAQKRADDYVNSYVPPPGPTKEELQSKADDLATQLAALSAEKADVDAALAAVIGLKLDPGTVEIEPAPSPVVSANG